MRARASAVAVFLPSAALVVGAWEAARPQEDRTTFVVVAATVAALFLIGWRLPRPLRRGVICGALAPPVAFGVFFVAAFFMMGGLE